MQNDPIGRVDLWGLLANDISNAVSSITQGITPQNLGDLVNTAELASIIAQNPGIFDPNDPTGDTIKGWSVEAIEGLLNQVTIYTGVNQSNALGAASALGVNLPSDTEAFSVDGNIIYMYGNPTDPNLLAHEAMHYLQSVASGGTVAFIQEYASLDAKYGYSDNPEEKTAYNLGPNSGSVLKQKEHKDWYIK